MTGFLTAVASIFASVKALVEGWIALLNFRRQKNLEEKIEENVELKKELEARDRLDEVENIVDNTLDTDPSLSVSDDEIIQR
jgi:hypothetical protein